MATHPVGPFALWHFMEVDGDKVIKGQPFTLQRSQVATAAAGQGFYHQSGKIVGDIVTVQLVDGRELHLAANFDAFDAWLRDLPFDVRT